MELAFAGLRQLLAPVLNRWSGCQPSLHHAACQLGTRHAILTSQVR